MVIRAQAMTTDRPDSFASHDMMALVGYGISRAAAGQVFEQAGIHFEYARALTMETKSGSIGAFVSLNGPRSFSVEILRKQTTSSPAVVRSEVIDGMVEDLVSRGLRKVSNSVISADFSEGVRQGVRVRLDNRANDLTLDGRALDADQVPVYLATLRGDPQIEIIGIGHSIRVCELCIQGKHASECGC